MKILLSVDGSEYTQRIMGCMQRYPEFWHAKHAYTVFHVALPVPHRAAAFAGADIVRGFYADDVEVATQPMRSFMTEQKFEATYASRIGHPADEIATFAENGKFDLVVMGSHGHGGLTSVVMGSVVAKVLARCTVPLLIVR
ncbi:MAG: universal stress protein [Gammaproteobacteria bacterium]|nr:universal stress protein [Gammaproteobacteria bacterium]MBU1442132.1 universal stress protein [Gammaproteobacteria bacterium]MBU2411129.1 universal stress protein [Gammaproteobacteria bacterium]